MFETPLFTQSKQKGSSPLIIFVDGGIKLKERFYQKMEEKGLPAPPGLGVGDADSAGEEWQKAFDYIFPSDKSVSDVALALKFVPPKTENLELWGFIGGRLDHQMIVLGELSSWLVDISEHQNKQVQGKIKDLHTEPALNEIDFLSSGKMSFEHQGTFSLLSLTPNEVQLQGRCRWPLKNSQILGSLSSLGLSNQANGKVTLSTSAPAFVYFVNDGKTTGVPLDDGPKKGKSNSPKRKNRGPRGNK